MGLISLQDTIDPLDEFDQWSREQDRRPLTEKADPLALSWVAYHVWTKNPHRRWVPWADLEVHEHDREMAQETRRYYRNKLAIQALKADKEPTPFQRELYEICNGGIMRECHKGMLYRLPYFYVEDIRRAELVEHSRAHQPDEREHRLVDTRTLRPWNTIFSSRRGRETMEYWFHDRETNYPVMLAVDYDNPLRSMVEYYFRNTTDCVIYGDYRVVQSPDDFRHWRLIKPEFHLG